MFFYSSSMDHSLYPGGMIFPNLEELAICLLTMATQLADVDVGAATVQGAQDCAFQS